MDLATLAASSAIVFVPFMIAVFMWRVYLFANKINSYQVGIACSAGAILLGVGLFSLGFGECMMAPKAMPDFEAVAKAPSDQKAIQQQYIEYVKQQPQFNPPIPPPWHWVCMAEGIAVLILSMIWMGESYNALDAASKAKEEASKKT